MDFGRGKLKEALTSRIERQFDRQPAGVLLEKSLVIGLFGEWGSGKSYLLEQIGQHFDPDNYKPRQDNAAIVPIRFNPWRFEAEEHLIVPLLLTARVQLETWRRKAERSRFSEFAQPAANVIKGAARKFDLLAVAFASTLKAKVGIPGFADVEIEFDKLRKAYNEEYRIKESLFAKSPWFLQELTSRAFPGVVWYL